MVEFINKFSRNIVLFFFGLITLLYVVGNIFFTVRMENELVNNIVSFNNGITLVNVISLFVLLIIIYYLINKNSKFEFYLVYQRYEHNFFYLIQYL